MPDYDHPEITSVRGRLIVLQLTDSGFPQHRIASLFDCNQGRVSEVLKSFDTAFRGVSDE